MSTTGLSSGMTSRPAAPRKHRRIFLWVFLALQAIFILWIVTGMATRTGATQGLSTQGSHDVSTAAHGLAIALQVIVWIVVDFLVALTYGIYRLARRTGR
jgi:uncharacterized membrane protein